MTTPMLGTDVELSLPMQAFNDITMVRQYEERMSSLGKKYQPTVIENVQLHPDSLACEFAIMEPASSVGDFMMKYQNAREIAQSYMGMHLRGYDWIDTANLPLFREDIMPTVFKAANTFGCAHDYIILRSGKVKLRDNVPDLIKFRSVKEMGIHFHIELTPEYIHDEALMAEAISSYYDRTRMLHHWDHPTQHAWYRKPMTFRPKSYGFEYRSLGAGLADNQSGLELAVTQAFRLMEEVFG